MANIGQEAETVLSCRIGKEPFRLQVLVASDLTVPGLAGFGFGLVVYVVTSWLLDGLPGLVIGYSFQSESRLAS